MVLGAETMMQSLRRINAISFVIASLVCLSLASLTCTCNAQFRGLVMPGGMRGEDVSRPEVSLATLQTDPELDSILEKAKRFQDDGNFRVATKLMQAVLERSGSALYTNDEQTYFSLVRQVERQLAALPLEGLLAYRIEADAEALALVSAGEQGNLADALNQVVSRYFISSVGDDAAVRLGRLYLDQYDFVSARRVFEKALTHPDLSVPKNEILAHVALCDLFLNDLKSAQAKSQQLAETAPDLRIARLVADEIEDIQAGRDNLSSARRSRSTNWEMPLATEHRYGVGLPVSDRMLGEELVAVFQYYFDPNLRVSTTSSSGKFLAGSKAHGSEVNDTQSSFERRMLASRVKGGWRPTGMLLFGPDEIYIKNSQEMVALKKSMLPFASKKPLGDTLKVNDPMISWQSLWKNLFEVDAGTSTRNEIVNRFGKVVRPPKGVSIKLDNLMPTSSPEIQTYGDTIAAQFSIYNGVLYSIEGRKASRKMSTRAKQRFRYGQNLTRTRNNHLVAYDTTQGGKVLWTLPRESVEGKGVAEDLGGNGEAEPNQFWEQGGLMGAPVGYQNSIIAPINQNGSIWIYAFDPDNEGATLWKSHLCDEPTTGANPWSAINVSIDGNDLLVSCGLGVVFALDAATGQIRIARRYERGGQPDRYLGNKRWPGEKRFAFDNGWSSDTIIPYGRQMICFSSDASAIESIDRETGETLWKSDFDLISRKLDYLLGVYEGVLYAAGPETIVAFNLETRQLIWGGDDLFGGDVSLGKGILTPQGIFVPAENKILQFALMPRELTTQPDPVRSISVDLGGAEVGNLFSDGERFWVHGGNRVYALEAKGRNR